MSDTDITSTAVDGEQTCAHCASYAQELTSANERNDALTKAMKQMEDDALVGDSELSCGSENNY